jgi:hypothetical protein
MLIYQCNYHEAEDMLISTTFLTLAMMADAATAAPPAVAAKPADPMDKVTCRRELETGSLVKTRKDCRTRREWNRRSENAQAEGQRLTPHIGFGTERNP